MNPNGHILIVEDESINSAFIEYQLTKLGYSIAGTATSGGEAIELANQTKPDLVLMDIQLEGDLDGVETARAIRRSLGTPVVYLTSTSDDETIDRARTTGAFGYLQKPFHEQEVHSTIQMALSKAEMESRLRGERKWLATALRWVSDAVIAADPTGAIRLVNPAAERMTGWPQADALERDIDEIFHLLDPETRRPAESVIVQLMAQASSPAISLRGILESRTRTQASIEATATCITSDTGEVTGILVVFRESRE